MKSAFITAWLLPFARKQLVYLLLASSVVAVFWAITGHGPSLAATLIYSFVLGNLTTLTLELAGIPCFRRWSALVSVGLFLVIIIIPVAVIIATGLVFVLVPPLSLPPAPRTSFWDFLVTAWRFPFVASLIFGGGYFAYVVTRTRLEDRNRRLQQTIDSNRVERKLDDEELLQAREIQERLLPKEIPQVEQFEITGVWEPAKVVGGDYYDVIRLSKDKLGICVADVVGKGISAALLMANVQASVRAFASESASPSRLCSNINSVLCANLACGKFVTLFYGVLDARSRTLCYTSAGHLRPILIDSNGRVDHLESGGALLGVFPDWKYEDVTLELKPGDLLLLFTDGITEAMTPEGEEFGEDRLAAAATASLGQSLHDLQLHLLGQVKNFCHHQMSHDATLILVAFPGGGSEERNHALSRTMASEQLVQYAGVQP